MNYVNYLTRHQQLYILNIISGPLYIEYIVIADAYIETIVNLAISYKLLLNALAASNERHIVPLTN